MGKSPCCDQVGVKKGPWTPEEDKKLVDYIEKHGHGSWRNLPRSAGLNRCGKSCRLRWTNYLRPDIKRGKFSNEEEALIINLHSILGNKWSLISSKLPGRTDNEIKNYWNTHIKKKLLLMGIDPVTHQRRVDLELLCKLPSLLALPNAGCSPVTPWDGALARAQLLQCLLQAVLLSSAPPSVDIIHQLFGTSPAPPADMVQVNRQPEEQQWDPTGVLGDAAPLQASDGGNWASFKPNHYKHSYETGF
ncbi:hypothetical protein HPP92_001523 [Vanilla planifolia]|uniref:Uncharacterized protein n=1 Tax=Vanilla planifolia TaxID=51239 RepID=A0A835S4E2_VANPL|nr:hypothetical protein HPP92_001523 [Vanilla planifolia]